MAKSSTPAKKTGTKKTSTKKSVTPEAAVSGEIVNQPGTENPENHESNSGTLTPPKNAENDNLEKPTSAVAIADPSTVIIGGVSTEALKSALALQTEQRKVIKDFVKTHLEDGVDFGRIHVMSKDKCADQYNCKKDYHYSKPVLFKPGQEKLFSLFQITGKLERDEETYQMLPNTTNLVAYKCVMYRGETIVGEGRGSATVGDKGRDVNATIKIAEKRARMDACLSLGFSEYFAQDLDDPDYKSAAENAQKQAAARAEAIDKDEFGLFPRDPKEPIDEKERPVLFKMMLEAGVDKYYVIDALKLNGIAKPETMTSGQARGLMGLLKENAFKIPEQQVVPTDPEVIPDSQLPEDNYRMTPSKIQEAQLVVDDDLKAHVQEQFDSIGFNARGKMWFMKHVAGKPFGAFEKFTDEEWRRAYQHIEDIMDVKVEVAEEYMQSEETAADDMPPAVANVFPGATALPIATAPDGSKVNTQTGEILGEDGEPIIPDDI